MFKRLALPFSLSLIVLCFGFASSAGAYTVAQCYPDVGNPSSSDWDIRADQYFGAANNCAQGHGITLDTGAGGLNSFRNFFTGANVSMSAPGGTHISYIQANIAQMHDQHGLQAYIPADQRNDNFLLRFRLGNYFHTDAQHDFTPHPYTGGEVYPLSGNSSLAIAEIGCGEVVSPCVTKPVIFGSGYIAPFMNIRNMRYDLVDDVNPAAALNTPVDPAWRKSGAFTADWSASDQGGGLASARLVAYGSEGRRTVLSDANPQCARLANGWYQNRQPCPLNASGRATTNLSDGVYRIVAEARDLDGRAAESPGATFRVDATAPEVQVESAASSSRTINWTVSDPTSGVKGNESVRGTYYSGGRTVLLDIKRLESPQVKPGVQSYQAVLPDSLNSKAEITLVAIDQAGNQTTTTLSRDFTPAPAPVSGPAPKPAPQPAPAPKPSPGGSDNAGGDAQGGCLLFGEEEDDSISLSLKLGKRIWVKGEINSDGAVSLARSSKKVSVSLFSGQGKIALSGKSKKLSGDLPAESDDYTLSAKAGKKSARSLFSVSADNCE